MEAGDCYIETKLLVEKPDKTIREPVVTLVYCHRHNTVSVRFVGESALAGYSFDIYCTEIDRLFKEGIPVQQETS